MNDIVNTASTIRETLVDASQRLDHCSDSPRLDAELLLARALDVPRSYLVAHPEDRPDGDAGLRFETAIAERERGVPLAYIVGEKEFWSLTFHVTPDTLVPRPDTELLVEKALALIPRESPCRVLDLGTGSGAVALSIAQERRHSSVVATDNSSAALAVAQRNVNRHGLANVELLEGDWTDPVSGRLFDVIVSNPPYVCAGDPVLLSLAQEPASALVSGDDGLDAIRELAGQCGAILDAGGRLMIEHGSDQQEAVADTLRDFGWEGIECYRDLAGLPRVTAATHKR